MSEIVIYEEKESSSSRWQTPTSDMIFLFPTRYWWRSPVQHMSTRDFSFLLCSSHSIGPWHIQYAGRALINLSLFARPTDNKVICWQCPLGSDHGDRTEQNKLEEERRWTNTYPMCYNTTWAWILDKILLETRYLAGTCSNCRLSM